MPGSAALTGNDTTILDGRIFKDFAEGDVVTIEYPNNLTEGKVGKNGNVIFAFNSSGKSVNIKIRVLLGSSDDKYLNSRVQEYVNDSASFVFITGEFVKRVGDGKGNISNITYLVDGGVIQKIPGAKENVSGDTEQAVAEYMIFVANADRAIQ